MTCTHLEQLLDDFSEEVGQSSGVCNGSVGSNGRGVAVTLLIVGSDEGVEQQRQPVPGKIPQYLCISASIRSLKIQQDM